LVKELSHEVLQGSDIQLGERLAIFAAERFREQTLERLGRQSLYNFGVYLEKAAVRIPGMARVARHSDKGGQRSVAQAYI
jgi:hypothetical protein